MEIALLWLVFAVLVAFFANSKNRSGISWFFIAALLSPLVAFIILLVVGSAEAEPIASTSQVSEKKEERVFKIGDIGKPETEAPPKPKLTKEDLVFDSQEKKEIEQKMQGLAPDQFIVIHEASRVIKRIRKEDHDPEGKWIVVFGDN
jgi:hypothetical protein